MQTSLPSRITIALLAALPCIAAAAEPVRITYSEPLVLLPGAATDARSKPNADSRVSLAFDAFGRRFVLDLAPNRTLTVAGHAGTAYRGTISGMPGSWARVSLNGGVPEGLMFDGQQLIAIERRPGVADGRPVVFRLADLHFEPGALGCEVHEPVRTGAELLTAMTAEKTVQADPQAPSANSVLEVGVLADSRYLADPLNSKADSVLARMNIVDGIFSEQLGVEIQVSSLDIFDSASDPFSGETTPVDLLNEVGTYRLNTPAQRAFGLTHLFTGRELDGATKGIAYLDVLCSARFGVGLTQASFGITTDALIAAHEFGHNFAAPHDAESGTACESTPSNFLMAPRVSGSDQFSACSISIIEPAISSAACIAPRLAVDMAIEEFGEAEPILYGETATLRYSVLNVGSAAADDVTVSIPLGGETLVSVSATVGTCSGGADAAQCNLGQIGRGGSATITLEAIPERTGSPGYVATVTATADENSANDSATARVPVEPVAELSVTAPAANVLVDQRVTIAPVITNAGAQSASEVVVTITAAAGLRVEDARWPQGECSTVDNVVTCEAGSLAATSSEISLGVTGVSVGDRSYSVEIGSVTADTVPGNNTATGNVRVTASAPSSGGGSTGGGGGGGAVGLGWLALLAGGALRRRMRTRYSTHA